MNSSITSCRTVASAYASTTTAGSPAEPSRPDGKATRRWANTAVLNGATRTPTVNAGELPEADRDPASRSSPATTMSGPVRLPGRLVHATAPAATNAQAASTVSEAVVIG